MSYRVEIVRSAEREFERLPKVIQGPVRTKMLALEANPIPPSSKKLRGSSHHRIRSGDYRIIYSVNHGETSVTILSIGHRKDVYRKV